MQSKGVTIAQEILFVECCQMRGEVWLPIQRKSYGKRTENGKDN
jgi:hypothetical protein